MTWVTSGDVAAFLEAAGDFLRAERARNTIFLTACETIRRHPERYAAPGAGDAGSHAHATRQPLFGWWTNGANTGSSANGGATRGAFLHTPPFPLLLTAVPPQAAADLAATTLRGRPLPGVNAYAESAAAFATTWAKDTGCEIEVHRRQRLYRLGELAWPDPPPDGEPRQPGAADTALLTGWFEEFAVEVNDLAAVDQAAEVTSRLSYGGLTLWESGGTPVALAGLTRQVAGMVRVGPVYTPPQWRGRGYGSAVTAEVSRAALAAGADEVLLYTDLDNPVSNSIYRHIGYHEVEDRVVLSFTER